MYYDESDKTSFSQRMFSMVRPLARCVSYEKWNNAFDCVTARYTGRTNRLSYVNGMVWTNRRKYWMLENEIRDTVMLEFEVAKFPAPIGYDCILRRLYGDYMKFPVVSERAGHCADKVLLDPDVAYQDYFRTKK